MVIDTATFSSLFFSGFLEVILLVLKTSWPYLIILVILGIISRILKDKIWEQRHHRKYKAYFEEREKYEQRKKAASSKSK